MKRIEFTVGVAGSTLAAALPVAASGNAPSFHFQSNFWMSLHHTLYYQAQVLETVFGSGSAGLAPMDRKAYTDFRAAEARDHVVWSAAIRTYHDHYASLDMVFSDLMANADDAIAMTASGGAAPRSAPEPMREALRLAAPVYRDTLWPKHDVRNRAFIAVAEANLRSYRTDLASKLSRIYQTAWLSKPYIVDVVPYAEWEGSYGNDAGAFFHIVMSADYPDGQNLSTIDLLFHEASHSIVEPDAGRIGSAIERASKRYDVPEPDQFWHAVIMYTPGRLAEQTFDQHDLGPYTMVWLRLGLFTRRWPRYYRALERHWFPYMQGNGTPERALDACVREIVTPSV